MQTLRGGLWASRASEWKALAQTENKVCPVSGGGPDFSHGKETERELTQKWMLKTFYLQEVQEDKKTNLMPQRSKKPKPIIWDPI